jgi:hypothetical protein
MFDHPIGRAAGRVPPGMLHAYDANQPGLVLAGKDCLPGGEAAAVERGHPFGVSLAAVFGNAPPS